MRSRRTATGRTCFVLVAALCGSASADTDLPILLGTGGDSISILHTFFGDGPYDQFGSVVAGAGDIDGDGHADLLAEAPGWDDGGNGYVRIFSGADGSVLHSFLGDQDIETVKAAALGDVDGDSYDDFVVGATQDRDLAGTAYVLSGSDGTILHEFPGDEVLDRFGTLVASAGDVDGDAVPDPMVYGFRSRGSDTVYVRLFSGASGTEVRTLRGAVGEVFYVLAGLGDVDGDGRDDYGIGGRDGASLGFVRLYSGADGSLVRALAGDAPFDNFGRSLSAVGDLNKDGRADFMAGAWAAGASYTRVYSGADGSVVYAYVGDGAEVPIGWTVGGTGDLNGDGYGDFLIGGGKHVSFFSGKDGSFLTRFSGKTTSYYLGGAAAGAGDVDGDAVPDVIVGAPNADDAAGDSGTVFVVAGHFFSACIDQDGDGFGDPPSIQCGDHRRRDCDDEDPTIVPLSRELCNGRDDNCDGRALEEEETVFPDLGDACSVGVGACLREGVRICRADGLATSCDVEPGLPSLDLCNGIDDDCNGIADEAFPDLGSACSGGVEGCSFEGTIRCTGDGLATFCDSTDIPELCNGADDDCDGVADEGFDDLGAACAVGVGACRRTGAIVCAASGLATTCSAVPGEPGLDLCNGADDDCDGTADDGFPDLGTACEIVIGGCRNVGVRVCSADGFATECDAMTPVPAPELCNGADDDCDGEIDEDFDDDGDGFSSCGGDCDDGDPDRNPEVAEVRGNGVDDDCDGVTDERFANLADVRTLLDEVVRDAAPSEESVGTVVAGLVEYVGL